MTRLDRIRALVEWCERHDVSEPIALDALDGELTAHVSAFDFARLTVGHVPYEQDFGPTLRRVDAVVDGVRVVAFLSYPQDER